jgi:hypothetical protein
MASAITADTAAAVPKATAKMIASSTLILLPDKK